MEQDQMDKELQLEEVTEEGKDKDVVQEEVLPVDLMANVDVQTVDIGNHISQGCLATIRNAQNVVAL